MKKPKYAAGSLAAIIVLAAQGSHASCLWSHLDHEIGYSNSGVWAANSYRGMMDVLTVAQIAGIQAAKATSTLIPLCHTLALTGVDVQFTVESDGIRIRAAVRTTGKTGVEMEALTAVSVAALTLYDMCKAVDKQMSIGGIHVVEKKKE